MTGTAEGPVDSLPSVPEKTPDASGGLAAADFTAPTPFVVRGLVRDWPLVEAGKRSADAVRSHLLGFYNRQPVLVSVGPPEIRGRIFYREDMSVNISVQKADLQDLFDRIAASEGDAVQPCLYVAAAHVDSYFPGLLAQNPIDLGGHAAPGWIWMGTRTQIAPHNDTSYNLACNVAGRRRFVVFPPDQFRNLYLGPIDNTPAGRTISMVDVKQPDFERFPRFRRALAMAQVAELEAGDAIYMPPHWWHHVEGLDPFNILLNFWWKLAPDHLGMAAPALDHAILALRDLPESERSYWRDIFDYYVFNADDRTTGHIPRGRRGLLDPLTPKAAQSIRAKLKGYFQR